VACRAVAERWLCKKRPLLGKARNIHGHYYRTPRLCNPSLSNGSVNIFPWQRTPTQQ
jgi:hypothetical protein